MMFLNVGYVWVDYKVFKSIFAVLKRLLVTIKFPKVVKTLNIFGSLLGYACEAVCMHAKHI